MPHFHEHKMRYEIISDNFDHWGCHVAFMHLVGGIKRSGIWLRPTHLSILGTLDVLSTLAL